MMTPMDQAKSLDMTMHSSRRRLPMDLKAALVISVCSAALISACSDSDTGSEQTFNRVNESNLHISKADLYYGTRVVGSVSTQSLLIENRGADQYSLSNMVFDGLDSDSFKAQGFVDTLLLPAESIQVNLSFTPSSQGQKSADFVVDYQVFKQASDADNANEQNFYRARDLEEDGQFGAAAEHYASYVANDPVTSNERLAAIKMPILEQSRIYGEGPELSLYLEALDQQLSGNHDQAIASLAVFDTLYADSYLADDSVYLLAYIQLMMLSDAQSALSTLQRLRSDFPDTRYYDSALFAEANAHISLGNQDIAREILLDLRYRHQGTDVLGIQLPKDNLESRLWFKRASDVLVTL